MIYELPPLPYAYDALEPLIDAETMRIHHDMHHAGYVNKLNGVLAGHESLSARNLESILHDIRCVPEESRQDVRNHGGGHLNHTLFWQILAPPGRGGQPEGRLRQALIDGFGDIESFRSALTAAAMGRFGSGWAWLALDDHGKCHVLSTPNQDSPIMLGYQPVLGLDVWEHAYYLQYRNRRADYVEAWWKLVDWAKVAEIYRHRMDMTLRMK